MYLKSFNLREHPFRVSPDPSFLYLSKQHAQAKAYMDSALLLSDGFVVITGDIGCGKTTLSANFIENIDDENIVTAKVYQTQITPVQFLQTLLAELGFRPFKKHKAELLNMINTYLEACREAGRRVVLVVDEAQNLTDGVLEEIRLLSGIETGGEKVLSIILVGQPEFGDVLDADGMEQLRQRTRLRFHLGPLDEEETREYVEHRLSVAGDTDSDLFSEDCFEITYRYTGGVPRLINNLCDTAMICAFGDDQTQITAETIKTAIDELQWDEYHARTSTEHALAISPQSGRRTPAKLRIVINDEPVKECTLRVGRIIIGRTTDNDIQINSEFVSRHHAQLITSTDDSVLEDLNSTNGIFVNSERVKKRRLRDGDIIGIGTCAITYARKPVGKDETLEPTNEG